MDAVFSLQIWDVFSECKSSFIAINKMQKEQTDTAERQCGRPENQGLFITS